MGRVLLIAIACVAGALVTWLFVPTIQPVGVNPDMPVFSRDDQSKPPANAQGAVSPMMSAEKRRSRAEQLVGTPLKYVTSGRVLTVD
ncbi:MAG TPA: hypothetical protein VFE34_03640 [Dongiaceae bacterium]|jgi:hypothetical protein|nr:hypothetical protein [Dongiaceae bacterium]